MGRWISPDSVNVTDDRIFSPTNTLNKYVYGANNPLKYVDPDVRDITIFYYPGGPAGHIVLLAYDPQTGQAAYQSYGPASHDTLSEAGMGLLVVPVPGKDNYGFEDIKSADDLRRQAASLTIQTSPEVTQQAIQAILSSSGGPYYITLFNNCTTTCARTLRQLQLTKSRAFIPLDFFTELYAQYGKQKAPSFQGIYLFQPGKDYGPPHIGWDPFDVLYMQLHPLHEIVTVKMCHTDENGKVVCQ